MSDYVLYDIGMWMIIATAVLFLLLTFVVIRLWPQFVWPLLVVSWVLGTLGFLLVCVDQPTLSNAVFGVLFVAASVGQGFRLKRRADKIVGS
jgi:hypothetical protein